MWMPDSECPLPNHFLLPYVYPNGRYRDPGGSIIL
jgi:hypothetical protein